MDAGPLSADEFRDRLRGRRLDDPVDLTDEDDTVVLVEADDVAGVATRRDVGSTASAGIATRGDEPRPPLGPPGTGGGWLAGPAGLTELDDGGFAPAGPTGGPVPPPPDGLDDLRDDAVVDDAPDAAADESLMQRAIDDLADPWDDGRTSAGSGRGAIDDALPSADDVAGHLASGAPAEAEEKVPTEGPDTTPPTRRAIAGSRDDPPTSADAAVLQPEVLARLSDEETRLALTPRRALELVKDAAWAAQEARERAARAEGEASALRYELDRLGRERAELTALLAETRHRWLSRRR